MAKGQLFGGAGSRERFACAVWGIHTHILFNAARMGREGDRPLNLKVVPGYYEGIFAKVGG